MNMNRREFIAAALAGTAGLAMNCAFRSARFGRGDSDDPYRLVPLGKTGLNLSLIGFGTGMRGGNRQSNQTRLGRETFEALLKTAYEKGIRYFDCADLYGTHPYVGRVLKSVPRESVVIGTKIWDRSGGIPEAERPAADAVVDRFRRELDTDCIDLVLLHCMTDARWPEMEKRQMDILENLKAKRVIRAHGVSVHNLDALKVCVDSPWVDSVHVRINAFGDSMDNKDPAVVADILRQLHAAGKGVIGMKLVGEGRYRNDPEKRDRSIQYVLGLQSVDAMVVGFEKEEEMDDFAVRVKKVLGIRTAQKKAA